MNISKLKTIATSATSTVKDHLTDRAKRTQVIKNTVVIAGAVTVGMIVSPAKAIGVLVTKMPCLDHDDCIVTTIQEFDI